VALSYVSPALAYLPALVTRYSLDLLTGTIRLIGHFRVSDVRVPTPSSMVCWAAVAAFTLTLLVVRRRRLAALGIASLLAAALAIVVYSPKPQWKPGVLEITAIDVGQGDSLLIITPEGRTLLLDAGGLPGNSRSDFDVGEEVVSPYLWSRGIRHLDAVAISHAHSDHMGGMRTVIANFQPQEIWYGVESPTKGFELLEETARENRVALMPRVAGEGFEFGGAQFRVLNPQPWWPARNPAQDDESMVLRVQYGGTSALLVGDAHIRIEKLLEQETPQSDLLKVGHHGSMTSSSQEFLDAVKPRFAVVSVGFYNSFTHPRPEVMQRFAESHIQTFRTDLAGAVTFYLDGKTVAAKPVLR
jgi:competence protein ComEC